MTRMFVFSVAMVALGGFAQAETFAEKMDSYEHSQESIVRGQSGCHPFYASVSAGWSHLSNVQSTAGTIEFDSGLSGNVALGWFEDDFRVELEYSKFNFSLANNNGPFSTDVEAWMINGYYDIPITGTIDGYVGAGVGVGRTTGHGNLSVTSELLFTYQARAGITKCLTNRVDWFGGYRFLATETGTLDDGTNKLTDKAIAHATLETGLRFKF